MGRTSALKLAAFFGLALVALVAGLAFGASSGSLDGRSTMVEAADCTPWPDSRDGPGWSRAILARGGAEDALRAVATHRRID